LLITLLSGVYPAWLVTRVQTVNVLKGQTQITIGKARFNLRKGLIIFQFSIAQLFVIAAIIVGQQLQYTLDKNLGFDREAVLTIDLPSKVLTNPIYKDKQFVFKEELVKNSNIAAVALGDKPLSGTYNFNDMVYQSDTGKIQERMYLKFADENLLDLYDFKIIAGNKTTKSDTVHEFLINETAVKAFGFEFPEQAVGKQLETRGNSYPIVGVVKDFHNFYFKSEISPIAFLSDKTLMNTVNIKLHQANSKQWQRTISEIEKTWKAVYPDAAFEYKFYDETIANLYTKERNMSKIIRLATGITILISCLGLFGLATLTAFQRIKEIGIRKVLGASVVGIVKMLSGNFVKLVFIATLIASPISWWAMNKWLQDFAYRIEIQWWMFALAGMMAVVIALLTVSFQAVKAAVANPVNSLRDE
jgi:ABC-type antimicrobial peptide transport system permease subunit